jgi:integral membrane protein
VTAGSIALRRLRAAGWLEGGSFLFLLFVAMPLKYLAAQPLAVRIVGMIHGLLFIAYCAALAHTSSELGWAWRRRVAGFVASIVPFGVFLFDASLRREQATVERTER